MRFELPAALQLHETERIVQPVPVELFGLVVRKLLTVVSVLLLSPCVKLDRLAPIVCHFLLRFV